jgi:hypothetical protein
MALVLQSFADGDSNYIPKHNQNYGAIAAAVDGLSAQIVAAAGAAVSEGSAFTALFGTQAALVGVASYLPVVSGTSLNVAGGFFWRPSTGALSARVGSTTLAFVGVAAGTYYLQVDSTGAVSRSDTASEAAYSVVWTGSAFGTITRLGVIVFGAADWLAAQTSAALSATYTSLDARLEAGESLIAGAAPLASPTFTGTPAAPTAAPGTNTTQLATTAFIQAAVAALVDSAPGTLNTLNELATALGDDPNFATTLTTALGLKAPIASPTFTGVPAAPTAAPGTGTTQLATTAFVSAAVAAAGGGDVVGPSSATADHVATFNGTTGKLIKDSGLVLSGTNTGDQTSVSGNAGTATALQTSRNIDGQAFNGTADITVIAPGTHAATGKTTPVDADEMPLVDSAASNVLKKLTWANLKATLKTYLDTLYAPLSQPFDAAAFYPGIPTASAKVARIPIARAVTFAGNFAGSYFAASANATATTVFDVQKNGSSIGSVSIAAGGTTATFTTTSGTAKTFAAGDVLAVIAPATPDTTLADPGFVLAGTR